MMNTTYSSEHPPETQNISHWRFIIYLCKIGALTHQVRSYRDSEKKENVRTQNQQIWIMHHYLLSSILSCSSLIGRDQSKLNKLERDSKLVSTI